VKQASSTVCTCMLCMREERGVKLRCSHASTATFRVVRTGSGCDLKVGSNHRRYVKFAIRKSTTLSTTSLCPGLKANIRMLFVH
jgi:hypothetical protein